jgi:hypothetical protein
MLTMVVTAAFDVVSQPPSQQQQRRRRRRHRQVVIAFAIAHNRLQFISSHISSTISFGVNCRGEEAAELTSVNELYEGALNETTELPEELVRVRTRPGDERIELAEPDRTVSGVSSRRQEREDESDDDDDDFIDSVEVRPEGGFLLDGICKRSKYMTRMFVKETEER